MGSNKNLPLLVVFFVVNKANKIAAIVAKSKISATAQIHPQGHDQQKNRDRRRRYVLFHTFIVQRVIKTNELLLSIFIL